MKQALFFSLDTHFIFICMWILSKWGSCVNPVFFRSDSLKKCHRKPKSQGVCYLQRLSLCWVLAHIQSQSVNPRGLFWRKLPGWCEEGPILPQCELYSDSCQLRDSSVLTVIVLSVLVCVDSRATVQQHISNNIIGAIFRFLLFFFFFLSSQPNIFLGLMYKDLIQIHLKYFRRFYELK